MLSFPAQPSVDDIRAAELAQAVPPWPPRYWGLS